MAGKLVKKGTVAPTKPAAPKPTGQAVRKAVVRKVATRASEQDVARSAWRKLFGG